MGTWCFICRQPPDVYMALSNVQREQFQRAAHDAAKKGWV